VAGFCDSSNELTGSIKRGGFIGQAENLWLFNEETIECRCSFFKGLVTWIFSPQVAFF
jgi:hypothetical protein